MQLTIVRHGQTIENVKHIIQGQLPGILSATGQKQILAVAEQLRDDKFDVIYSSDLKRCLDTTAAIIAFHPNTPLVITPLLRERNSGSFQGKVVDWKLWESLPGTDITRKYPGGESWLDVKLKMPVFLNDLYSKYPDKHLLLITHSGVIQAIRSCIEGRSLEDVREEPVPNTGVFSEVMNKLVED